MVSKHDKILKNLEKILRNDTDDFGMNVEYGNPLKLTGEIDLYFTRNNTLYLFEVKCNAGDRCYTKALDQLVRAEKKFVKTLPYNVDRVLKYFVSGYNKSNTPKVRLVK